MDLIDYLVELLEQLGLLLLQILELLVLDLVLPLDIFVLSLSDGDLALSILQLHLDVIALVSLLLEILYLLLQGFHRLDDVVVSSLLNSLVLVGLALILQVSLQILSQSLNHVQICPCNLTVVLLDVIVLLVMLLLEGLDGCVLLGFNFFDLFLPLLLHILSQ